MKKLSNSELSAFCTQMAMILETGISAQEGIGMMRDDAEEESSGKKTDEFELLTTVYDSVAASGSLAAAFKETLVFPEYFCRMTEIGEVTGTLDVVMNKLARFYAQQDAVSQSVHDALTYPLIMTAMMVVIVVVLLVKVMPVFNQVFAQFGIEMNSFSKGALALGQAMSRYAVVFIGVIVLLAVLFFVMLVSKRFAKVRNAIFKRMSIFNKIYVSRFTGGLALALKSGLSPEQGVILASELDSDGLMKDMTAQCLELVQSGTDISAALCKSKIITGTYGRLIDIAGHTGHLDEEISRVSEIYGDEVDSAMLSLISALEPTIVIILAVIVGIILLSVMLPLLGILSGL